MNRKTKKAIKEARDDELVSVDLDKMNEEWKKKRETLKWKLIEGPYWATVRFLENFKPRHIKWGFQKTFRGYSDSDLWNLDYAIAKKVLPMLKAYRKMKRVGTPISMFDDPMSTEYSDEEQEKANEKWNEILDKMIYAFTYSVHENDKKYEEYLGVEYEEGSDWRQTKESREKVWKRYEEGMGLFGKHFHSLWD